MKLPRSKLRGILRNSPKPLPSFAKAMEGSPCLHPRNKLRGIRRRRISPPQTAIPHEFDGIPFLNILSGPSRQPMLQELAEAH